jgi:hypothetical protein
MRNTTAKNSEYLAVLLLVSTNCGGPILSTISFLLTAGTSGEASR